MSFDPQTFALETLLWTGALIAFVLIVRRPVTRLFGAKTAYALWALPFLRLVFPPVVLPAWMAPEPTPVAALPVGTYELAEVGGGPVMLQPMVAETTPIDWLLVGLAVWLIGTVAFLVLRYGQYFSMRRELLDQSIPLGEREGVRLVETPATQSPVAFGVLDKVIALPLGFMRETEPTRRDLALEHELAHHRAHDLLANALVQPLFALHWFNPLGWVGWRAMRRDQEAACDARVVARCDHDVRETYASTIASFATGAERSGRVALAAPMACRVLGDKSIIHRLRSLTMSDISPRRRLAARTLMVCALAALPLTATITQAEAKTEPAPPAAPEAPAAPVAASVLGLGQDAATPSEEENVFVWEESEGDEDSKQVIRIERKIVEDGSGEPSEETSVTINGREATPEERAKFQARLKGLRGLDGEGDGLARELRFFGRTLREDGELSEQMEEVRRLFAERGELRQDLRIMLDRVDREMPEIRFECDGETDKTVQERVGEDGKSVLVVCRTAGLSTARSAIASARRAVERDRSLSESERAEALNALNEALEGLGSAN